MGNPDLADVLSIFRNPGQPGYFRSLEPFPKVELQALHLAAAILNKYEWWTKVNDADTAATWEAEALAQGAPAQTVRYVLAKVRHLAANAVRTTAHGATSTPGPVLLTVVSPDAVPADLRDRLRQQVAPLEDVPDLHKDWHPGSDKQVLDLVHPSLFCLYYNETLLKLTQSSTLVRAQPPWEHFIGAGHQPARVPRRGITGPAVLLSRKFQWLPSEIRVDQNGRPEIASYINNLHPHHYRDLYATLADVLERFIPLFERQLAMLRTAPGPVVEVDMYDLYLGEDYQPGDDEEDEDAAFEAWQAARPIREISMPDTYTPPPPAPGTGVSFAGRRLQVIFKLANIHLTPEKPRYNGGSWHIEGTANEAIVATGIYYYDVENIADDGRVNLDFRTAIDSPEYDQGDSRGVEHVYGLGEDDPLNQMLGSIATRQDMAVVFPNIFQHHVAPFELADKTRPGHRKILAMFLVDPSKTIVSTAAVPPQQIGWYTDALASSGCLPGLPNEVIRCIARYVGGLKTFTQARAKREELMAERRMVVNAADDELFREPFSLCEH
ncbi:hypothetical protein HK105_205198 [Polyrhizophydium stewartii]|uniref:DUF4246 domain-containing protein n=1 Tax=Polyrhizophydium stewartii TaxID=2732419 RepID=A0ABR4N711_9FUNG|nr:hypothetical protein HK105_001689 [Polyrhizophydium stewartii]